MATELILENKLRREQRVFLLSIKRRFGNNYFTLPQVAEIIDCSEDYAKNKILFLVQNGYLRRVTYGDFFWKFQLTEKVREVEA